MGLILVTPPLTAPVSLAEAKRQCRVHANDTTYDAEIQAYLDAAISHMDGRDGILQQCLEPQTWDLLLDTFSDAIEIPLGPLITIDEVRYFDGDGDEQELDATYYTADLASERQWVVLNSGFSWPTIMAGVNAVAVRFTSGYEGELDSSTYTSAVPAAIKQAILLLVALWFRQREAVAFLSSGDLITVPLAFEALVRPYKRPIIA